MKHIKYSLDGFSKDLFFSEPVYNFDSLVISMNYITRFDQSIPSDAEIATYGSPIKIQTSSFNTELANSLELLLTNHPVLHDDNWTQKPYELFDFDTKSFIDLRTEETQWAEIRKIRNEKLIESDWTQLPDVPLDTKTLWASYRQELRDVTNQSDPFNIIWPIAPQ